MTTDLLSILEDATDADANMVRACIASLDRRREFLVELLEGIELRQERDADPETPLFQVAQKRLLDTTTAELCAQALATGSMRVRQLANRLQLSANAVEAALFADARFQRFGAGYWRLTPTKAEAVPV